MALQFVFGTAITTTQTDAKPALRQKDRKVEKVSGTTGSDGTVSKDITNGLSKDILSKNWVGDQAGLPQSMPTAEIVDDDTLLVGSTLGDQDPGRDFEIFLITKLS